jgi:chromosome partitioning protein
MATEAGARAPMRARRYIVARVHRHVNACGDAFCCTDAQHCYNAAMHLLVLHTPKGGSGKSTLARELAVAADLAGVRVALADLDPQGTVTGWYRRRAAKTPPLLRYVPGSDGASYAGLDLLVLDTPPGAPPYMPALLAKADLVLVPCRPTVDDLLAAAPIARSLAGRQWVFVLTQVPTRSRMVASAVRQLAALGRVAPVQLGFRADYPAAAIDGQAAVEFIGTKAADESAQLFAYVRTLTGDLDVPPPEH